MNLWPYTFQLLPSMFLFSMAIEIYLRNPHNHLHRTTMLFFSCLSLLFFGMFIMNVVPLTESKLSVRDILLPASFLTMSIGLYFFCLLKYSNQLNWYHRLLALFPLLGFVVLYSPQNWVEITVNQGGFWRIEQYNSAFTWFMSGIALYSMAVLLVLLYTSYRDATSSKVNIQQRSRIRFILVGASLTCIWETLVFTFKNQLIALFPILPIPTVAAYSVILFALFIRFAMVKYDFLSDAARRYQILFTDSSNGIVLVDELGRIVEANAECLRIIGITDTEWRMQNITSFITVESDDRLFQQVKEAFIHKQKIHQLELQIRNYENNILVIEMNTHYIEGDGQILTYWMVKDITIQKEHERMLFVLAYQDSLTGLVNRRRFYEVLEDAQRKQQSDNQMLAVLLIDLDRFKWVNDTLGHAAGDVLLQTIAGRMQEVCTNEACIARLGGDEFVVLLPHIAAEKDALTIAEQFIEQFNKPVFLNELPYEITASIGVSLSLYNPADPEAVMRNADTAMYEAKKQGRNQFAVYK